MPVALLKAWIWLKGNALAVTSVITALALSYAYWQRKKREVGRLKDAVAVEKARSLIKESVAKKEVYKEQAADTEVLEQQLDVEIAQAKRVVVEIRDRVDDMPDEEINAAFSRLYDDRL